MTPTIHASCVLVGAKAVLIRGEAGSGKSRLALQLIQAAGRSGLPLARLVGDDRIHLEARGGRLLARPARELAGLLEIRGAGIQRVVFEPVVVVALVVDLAPAERLPSPENLKIELEGVVLPRLSVPPGTDPLPLVLEAIGRANGPI